jgi:hypothetical protein
MLAAQTSTCTDIADEPNHQLVFQNSNVRIFQLDLAASKSTQEFCLSHPYLRVIVTEGRTTDLVAGETGYGRNWKPGETRFVYQPKRKAIRNENGVSFREYDVEVLQPVSYDPRYNSASDAELLPNDPGGINPNRIVSVGRGPVIVSKAVLDPQDTLLVADREHLIIALSDIDLAYTPERHVTLQAGSARRLSAGTPVELTNAGTRAATFIMVEF